MARREELIDIIEDAANYKTRPELIGALIAAQDEITSLRQQLAEAKAREETKRDGHLCGHAEMGTYTGQVILVAPDWLKHKWPSGIGIDVCLALEIQQLWRDGIQTSGHCCGHGRQPAFISVWPEYIEAMKDRGYQVLPHHDGREEHFAAKTLLGTGAKAREAEAYERAAKHLESQPSFGNGKWAAAHVRTFAEATHEPL